MDYDDIYDGWYGDLDDDFGQDNRTERLTELLGTSGYSVISDADL